MSTEMNKAKSVINGAAGVDGKSSVHYDRPLSDFSIQVRQEDTEFKASKILSDFNSPKRQDMYYYYEPAYFMVSQVAARAEGQEASFASYGVSRKSYNTNVFGLKQPVTDETIANADMPVEDVLKDAVRFITRQFLIHKEKAIATALLAPSKWATDWAGQAAAVTTGNTIVDAGAFQQFDKATSKPLDVLDLAMERVQLKSGLRPNTLVMTRSVFTAMKRNPAITTTKLYTTTNSGSNDSVLGTIASHLDIPVENIHVLDAVEAGVGAVVNGTSYKITTDTEGYPSTTEDDDATTIENVFIGGKGILLMHVDKTSNGRYAATAAVCVQWTGLYPDGGALGNMNMETYRENRLHSEMVEGSIAYGYHIVAPALGIYLDNVIA